MTEEKNNLSSENEGFDIKSFLLKILTNWPLFAISLGIAYTIAYFINRYSEPIYSVSTSIIIYEDKRTTAELLISALDRYNIRRNLDNEISIFKSYSLTRKALNELDFDVSYFVVGRVRESKLYRSSPFIAECDTVAGMKKYYPINVTIIDTTKCLVEINNAYKIRKILKFGEKFVHPDFNFTLRYNYEVAKLQDEKYIHSKFYFFLNDLNNLTNLYRSKLSVATSEKKSTVVNLSIAGPNPFQEVDFLNKLCEVYIKNGLEEKNRAATNTIKFIDLQLANISDSLRKAEMNLQDFKLKNNIVDISKEGYLQFQKVSEKQTQRATLEIKLKYLQYLSNYVNSKEDYKEIIIPSVMGIDEPLLNSILVELLELRKQRSLISSDVIDNPSLSVLDYKIQKAYEALKESITQLISSTKIAVNEIEMQITSLDNDFKKIPITERKLFNIQRNFDLNNNIFNFLLQKRADAGIAKASSIADGRVLDSARSDNSVQISPQRSKNYMLFMLLGALIPLAIIFLIELFNTRINDLKDFDRLHNCGIIGSIGHSEKQSELPVFESPKSSLSESFRSLRTNLQYLLRTDNEKVILITSTISGEGKTFCAVNLAAILAMSNKKTVLIGLDLRRPKIHKLFNIQNDIGLSTFLISRNSYEEVVMSTNVNYLHIIPSGPVPPNPAELIETPEMFKLIERLRSEYDYIILDTPPVAIVTDALLLSKHADTSIFVVRLNFSSKEVIGLASDLAKRDSVKHLNVLVNDIKASGYYGYSYKYGYRYGLGYSYSYGYYNYNHEYYGESEAPKTFRGKLKNWVKRFIS